MQLSPVPWPLIVGDDPKVYGPWVKEKKAKYLCRAPRRPPISYVQEMRLLGGGGPSVWLSAGFLEVLYSITLR